MQSRCSSYRSVTAQQPRTKRAWDRRGLMASCTARPSVGPAVQPCLQVGCALVRPVPSEGRWGADLRFRPSRSYRIVRLVRGYEAQSGALPSAMPARREGNPGPSLPSDDWPSWQPSGPRTYGLPWPSSCRPLVASAGAPYDQPAVLAKPSASARHRAARRCATCAGMIPPGTRGERGRTALHRMRSGGDAAHSAV